MVTYGRYELLERLGRGGMAEVFLARMNGPMQVSRFVALKRILPEISTIPELNVMFLDEIRLAVQLSHPGIGAVYDFGMESGCIYLTLELIDGHDVRALLQRAVTGHPVPLEHALYIVAQVARALDYAHNAKDAQDRPLGIVHRDVTPSNIIISYRGDVKLVDFGIARAAAHVRMNMTRAGEIKGTPRYMSPEQASGGDVDWRSDLFSLATVLLELVVGHPAFKADNDVQALRLVMSGQAPEREKYAALIPEDVAAIVDRGMAADREARFQSGREMAAALERALRARAPAFGPHDLARMMEEHFADELAHHRQRMRGYAEARDVGRDVATNPAERALAMADTLAQPTPADAEPQTRAGKATTPTVKSAAGDVTDPVGQISASHTPSVPRRTSGRWLLAGAALSTALLVAWQMRTRGPAATDGAGRGDPVPAAAGASPRPVAPSATTPTAPAAAPTAPAATPTSAAATPTAPAATPTSAAATPTGAAGTATGAAATPTSAAATPTGPATAPTAAPTADARSAAGTKPALAAHPAHVARGFGTLNLQSSPWATVAIDGKDVGQTPLVGLRVAAGAHHVTLANPGLPPRTIRIVVPADGSIDRAVKLTD